MLVHNSSDWFMNMKNKVKKAFFFLSSPALPIIMSIEIQSLTYA